MIVALICTEGRVSEPAFLRALVAVLNGQTPRSISTNVEILPIPLGGNQGHVRLIETADQQISLQESDKDSILSLALEDEDSTIEKWIIVDYDDMDSRGVDVDELRLEVEAAGYSLIVNKPKFEFFVLAALSGQDVASNTPSDQYVSAINQRIDDLNKDLQSKGFTKPMLLPHYSKKTHIANQLFLGLLNFYPKLINDAADQLSDASGDNYTEMSIIIKRIQQLYSDR